MSVTDPEPPRTLTGRLDVGSIVFMVVAAAGSCCCSRSGSARFVIFAFLVLSVVLGPVWSRLRPASDPSTPSLAADAA